MEHKGTKHILWMDGLKGFACLAIVIHHFMVAFFPATYWGINHIPQGGEFATFIAHSPLSVVVNGNFFVCVFCLVSGFVLSKAVMELQEKDRLGEIVVKRFPRLAFPMFFVCLGVWLLQRLGLFTNAGMSAITTSPYLDPFYQERITIVDVVYASFYSVWMEGDATFSTAFWMLSILFAGSFMAILFAVATWKAKRAYVFLICLIAMGFYTIRNNYMMCFVFGTLFAYMYTQSLFIKNEKIRNAVGVIMLLLGLYLGGYPTAAPPIKSYSILAGRLPSTIQASVYYHVWGSFFMIFGMMQLPIVQRFFENKVFLKLSKISYAVYLIHIPIICSLSTTVFKVLYAKTNQYSVSGIATLVLTVAVVIGISIPFSRYVEKFCSKVTKYLVDKMYGRG